MGASLRRCFPVKRKMAKISRIVTAAASVAASPVEEVTEWVILLRHALFRSQGVCHESVYLWGSSSWCNSSQAIRIKIIHGWLNAFNSPATNSQHGLNLTLEELQFIGKLWMAFLQLLYDLSHVILTLVYWFGRSFNHAFLHFAGRETKGFLQSSCKQACSKWRIWHCI